MSQFIDTSLHPPEGTIPTRKPPTSRLLQRLKSLALVQEMYGRLQLLPPVTHPAPPAPSLQRPLGCCFSSAVTSSPQIRLPLPKPAPRSGFRAPARPAWWSGAGRGGGGRAPDPREEWSPHTLSTANPMPSPAEARRWPEAAPLASDLQCAR